MKINYAQLINTLLQDLSDRSREVVERRFGLTGPERETLEKVGKDFGITRERVRQIQEKAIKYIKMAMEEDELNATLMDHLADVYAKMDNKKKAIEYWQKALVPNTRSKLSTSIPIVFLLPGIG